LRLKRNAKGIALVSYWEKKCSGAFYKTNSANESPNLIETKILFYQFFLATPE
jgi:hypothetical protein